MTLIKNVPGFTSTGSSEASIYEYLALTEFYEQISTETN